MDHLYVMSLLTGSMSGPTVHVTVCSHHVLNSRDLSSTVSGARVDAEDGGSLRRQVWMGVDTRTLDPLRRRVRAPWTEAVDTRTLDSSQSVHTVLGFDSCQRHYINLDSHREVGQAEIRRITMHS